MKCTVTDRLTRLGRPITTESLNCIYAAIRSMIQSQAYVCCALSTQQQKKLSPLQSIYPSTPQILPTSIRAFHPFPPSARSFSNSARTRSTCVWNSSRSGPSIRRNASSSSAPIASSVPCTVGPRYVGLPIATAMHVHFRVSIKSTRIGGTAPYCVGFG